MEFKPFVGSSGVTIWPQDSERRIVSVTGPQYVCGSEKSRLFTFEQLYTGSSW